MAPRRFPQPKKFITKRRSRGGSRAQRKAVEDYNKKIKEANRLIDQGKISEASKIVKNLSAPGVQQRIQKKREQRRKAELERKKKAAENKKRIEERLRKLRERKKFLDSKTYRFTRFVSEFGLDPKLVPKKGTVQRDLFELQKEISKTNVNKRKAKNLLEKIKSEGKLVGLGATSQFLRNVEALIETPRTVKNLAEIVKKDPGILKEVPGAAGKALKRGTDKFVLLARTSPSEAIGRIGGEIIFLKGAGELLKGIGKGAEITRAKLSPSFKKVKDGKLILKLDNKKTVSVGVAGAINKGTKASDDLVTAVGRSSPKKPPTPPKPPRPGSGGGKPVNIPNEVILEVVKKLPKEKVAQQVKRAGSRVTGISSQRQALFNLLRRRRQVRKPIPGEENLPRQIRNQLKRFDEGKLSAKEIFDLDRAIKKRKAKGLLERSFFADPTGKIRPSRLGILEEEASILDLLKGNVRFTKDKPEILLFDNVKIQEFPKSLAQVKKKLKSGKPLSQKEADLLLKFQLKKSGKFKPLGFLSGESEITLAPGEIIKKNKKIATTLINGRKVNIVRAQVYQPTKQIKKLLNEYKKGSLTKKQLKSLDKKLKKETGIDYGVSYSKNLNKKYVPIKRISTSLGVSSIRPISKSGISRSFVTSKSSSSKGATSGSFKSTSKSGSSTSKSPPTPPKPPMPPRKRKRVKRKKSLKKFPGYNVYAKPIKTKAGKKAKRMIKINKVPLSKMRAEDLRNYVVDTSLGRTAKIKGTSSKAKKSKLNVPRGYSSKTKNKFRKYRQVKGTRKPLKPGVVIELKTKLLDTLPERKKIDVRKRMSQLKKSKKKRSR